MLSKTINIPTPRQVFQAFLGKTTKIKTPWYYSDSPEPIFVGDLVKMKTNTPLGWCFFVVDFKLGCFVLSALDTEDFDDSIALYANIKNIEKVKGIKKDHYYDCLREYNKYRVLEGWQ